MERFDEKRKEEGENVHVYVFHQGEVPQDQVVLKSMQRYEEASHTLNEHTHQFVLATREAKLACFA